jgi:hypothetical protein
MADETPKPEAGDKAQIFETWHCTACRKGFATSYGLRMHRVNEHGAPLRVLKRKKRRTQGSAGEG